MHGEILTERVYFRLLGLNEQVNLRKFRDVTYAPEPFMLKNVPFMLKICRVVTNDPQMIFCSAILEPESEPFSDP